MHERRLIGIFEETDGIDGDIRAIERANHRLVIAAGRHDHAAADFFARLMNAEREEDDLFAGANAANAVAEEFEGLVDGAGVVDEARGVAAQN